MMNRNDQWTDEKLDALDVAGRRNLLANIRIGATAGKIGTDDAEQLIARLELKLKSTPVRQRKVRNASHVTLEKRVARTLGALAEELATRYDLTPETATQLSAGTKRFKAHALTDKRGEAKTGGAVKEGKIAIDRYISYRVGDSLVSLAFVLFVGEAVDRARYFVMGTTDVLDEGEPFATALPDGASYGWSAGFVERMNTLSFVDLPAASVRYEALVAKLAPKVAMD